MTRDRAAQIIEAAIAADVLHEPLHIQLAHALDALGLLAFTTAADPSPSEQIVAAARIVSGNPLPLTAEASGPEYWAGKRHRT